MSFFANQKLAVRLGVAFGTVAVGLLIVGTIGFTQMGSLRGTTQDLDANHVVAQGLAGRLEADSLDIAHQAANHLYVHDGELAAQDGLQGGIASLIADAKKTSDQLAGLVKGTPAEDEYGTYVAESDRYFTLVDQMIRVSRRETVSGDDERAGSRGIYTGEFTKLSHQLDVAGKALFASVTNDANLAAAGAVAQAGTGRREVLIAVIIPLLFALAVAVIVTRSVTHRSRPRR